MKKNPKFYSKQNDDEKKDINKREEENIFNLMENC